MSPKDNNSYKITLNQNLKDDIISNMNLEVWVEEIHTGGILKDTWGKVQLILSFKSDNEEKSWEIILTSNKTQEIVNTIRFTIWNLSIKDLISEHWFNEMVVESIWENVHTGTKEKKTSTYESDKGEFSLVSVSYGTDESIDWIAA